MIFGNPEGLLVQHKMLFSAETLSVRIVYARVEGMRRKGLSGIDRCQHVKVN